MLTDVTWERDLWSCKFGEKTELKLYLFPTTDYLTGPVVYGVSQMYFPT